MTDGRVVIDGSELPTRTGDTWLGPVPDSEPVSVTLTLRRSPGASAPSERDLLSGNYQTPGTEAAANEISADPGDVAAVESFAQQFGLTVVSSDAATRRVRVGGNAAQVSKAFGVQLGWVKSADGQQYLSYRGLISVPAQLAGVVVAVLGLDLHVAAGRR